MEVNSESLTQRVSLLLSNSWAMDVYEIRKHNLRILEAEAESLKAIGDAMIRVVQERSPADKPPPNYPNVLSQHKGDKPMGAKIARLVEEAMGKPKGWMDALQEVDTHMDAKEAGQIAMNIPDLAKREAWLSMGRTLTSQEQSQALPFGPIPKGGKKGDPK